MQINPDQHQEVMTTLAVVVNRLEGMDKHLVNLDNTISSQAGQLNILELWKARVEGAGWAINLQWGLLLSLISGAGITIFYWLVHRQ